MPVEGKVYSADLDGTTGKAESCEIPGHGDAAENEREQIEQRAIVLRVTGHTRLSIVPSSTGTVLQPPNFIY